jgi:hypothetical protein
VNNCYITCPHSWHYKFKWKGRRYRAALDDVLHRHVSGKPEALKEVERIYDAIRDGTLGRESAATLTLRRLGERYFKAYVSPKTGRPLGRNERYRWNVMIETKVHGRPPGTTSSPTRRNTMWRASSMRIGSSES